MKSKNLGFLSHKGATLSHVIRRHYPTPPGLTSARTLVCVSVTYILQESITLSPGLKGTAPASCEVVVELVDLIFYVVITLFICYIR